MSAPARNQFERDQCRHAMANWLPMYHFKLSATLNFNRATRFFAAHDKFGEWLQRIDYQYLGRSWQKHPDRRAFAIAFFENQHTNPHLHVLFTPPDPPFTWHYFGENKDVPDGICHAHNLTRHWTRLVAPGSCNVKEIYDLAGIARYVAKQLKRPQYDQTFMISTEFHNR
jgi:hypothetical protein